MAEKRQRVLSIQSHVVSGYVGNKSATFPLQVLGFEVDTINSVQFSNHTGYGYWKGQVLNEKELEGLMDGLRHNGLDYYTHLLTGYIGSTGFLKYIVQVVKQLRQVNPDLVYVCDPVMGDNGKMYVPKELLEIYKDTILPLADIITPNQFEAELLSGKEIKSADDAWAAVEHFHKKGCRTIVLSSTDLGDDQNLLALASSRSGDKRTELTIRIPKLPGTFTGTGDLFAALLLAWMWHTNNQLKLSLEKVIATLQTVLERTLHYAKGTFF
ncbi:Pyridoxal kinase [Zootermopsis nevadensis]|uniref:Pyridoxal kinase n=1 Tax=Zootermopsis nevadensis TaxID=136037 RepID=A0A067RMG8_ZOONE|nr:Pyridoxal kinase [Zootermopsis nevadensis]